MDLLDLAKNVAERIEAQSARVPHPVFWTQECRYAATFIEAASQAVRASLGLRRPFFSISHSAL